MLGKLKSGSLILASWQIVKKEKGIIVSQVIGAVAWLVVFALGGLVVYNLGTSSVVMDNGALTEANSVFWWKDDSLAWKRCVGDCFNVWPSCCCRSRTG